MNVHQEPGPNSEPVRAGSVDEHLPNLRRSARELAARAGKALMPSTPLEENHLPLLGVCLPSSYDGDYQGAEWSDDFFLGWYDGPGDSASEEPNLYYELNLTLPEEVRGPTWGQHSSEVESRTQPHGGISRQSAQYHTLRQHQRKPS